MLLAVFSDTHDRTDHIEQALATVRERQIGHGIHLGDYCSPFTVRLLAESGLTWKCVWGNNDGDKLLCYQQAEPFGSMDFANGDFREITVDGRALFLTHYPHIARLAAGSGQYAAVFHGHDHVAAQETVGSTVLANPGELYGGRYGEPAFGIYNTTDNTFEHIRLTPPE
jgi:putative phosphoesterase